ncbi:unnamed protein product [Lymnaea stagnalis]|uniref:DUF4210 domain-containing protein n=1 Tax=Lymnaea stagnalis TaxID=6523 RepID=A0AAV2I4V8_LYMST
MCFSVFCQVNNRSTADDWKGGKDDANNNPRNGFTMNGKRTQAKWDQMPDVPEQAAIGNLHLSFEYHKTNLKIRVWQVTDLLLPPPQTSMIESIFVRSYLIPDPSKKTDRQTEYVKVETTSKDGNIISHAPSNGIQHIFTPSSFRFDTPLLYLGVTRDIIAERSLQLEVYMTQKQTHKTYLMGMVHLPLRTAVHRHLREKYPLIPCMNHTIPNSMRVYSARDLMYESSSPSWLNQSLSRSSSFHSKHRASFSGKDSEKLNNFMQRFSSLELSDSDDYDDGVGSSIGVKSSFERSSTSLAVTVDEGSLHTDDDDMSPFEEIRGHNLQLSTSVLSNGSETIQTRAKKKIIPNEMLERSSSSESGENSDSGSSTRRVSGKFTVIRVEETIGESGEDHSNPQEAGLKCDLENKSKEDSAPSQAASGKKRIIPNEFLSKISNSASESPKVGLDRNSNQAVGNNGVIVNVCDGIQRDSYSPQTSPRVLITQFDQVKSLQAGTDMNNDDTKDEIAEEVVRSRLYSHSSETGSAVGSRPETPVWDFYDFAAEEGAENKGGATLDDPSAPHDEASQALGTLQASLLKLSRGSQVLDTCRVIGPVLPTVMIDDFEMDDTNTEDSDDSPKDNDNDENNDQK